MRDAFDIISRGVMCAGLFGLAVIALVGVAMVLGEVWRVLRARAKGSKGAKIVALLAVVLATLYGGSKSRVVIDDPYIRDTGSYTTNDFVHISIAARYAFVPPDTEVLIWSREVAKTNATDWVQLVRAEEGPYRLGEFPLDIPFPDATNFNFMVAANYVPEPTVHTNGVWSIKGFEIPDETGKMAFPNTKTVTREETP